MRSRSGSCANRIQADSQEALSPSTSTRHTNVVVVGGGYAGVTAANRLTQRDDVDVTVINPRPEFVERIRLHQLVGGSDDAVVDYGYLLTVRTRLIAGEDAPVAMRFFG